jgi:hypothetical protein
MILSNHRSSNKRNIVQYVLSSIFSQENIFEKKGLQLKANLCIHKTQLHIKLIRTESKGDEPLG